MIARRRRGGSRIGRRRERVEAIVALRRLRFTAAEIAETLGMALSTVSGILTRLGLGRLGRLGLEQPRPLRALAAGRARARRRQEARPDRGRRRQGASRGGAASTTTPTAPTRAGKRRQHVGCEYVHIAVDDYSRLAYAEVLADEKATTAIGFLRRAVAFYRRHGITVERVLTDNGAAYAPPLHALACRSARHPPPPHPPLPAADQRQSRALHPHPARRLGLRRHLPLKPANAPQPLTAGSGTTTIEDDTQPSATNPRSAEPTCSGPTFRDVPRRKAGLPAAGIHFADSRSRARIAPCRSGPGFPVFVILGDRRPAGLLALLGRIRNGRYLQPVVAFLAKIPLFKRWFQKAQLAALERQNPSSRPR